MTQRGMLAVLRRRQEVELASREAAGEVGAYVDAGDVIAGLEKRLAARRQVG